MARNSHSERSIHEMLKDTPSMNESNSAIHSGTDPRLKHTNSLPIRNISAPTTPVSSMNIGNSIGNLNLGSSGGGGGGGGGSGNMSGSQTFNGNDTAAFLKNSVSKIDSLKNWSISTYKCTRQLMLEKLGKSTRTIDSELETQIEQLRDTQRKYMNILRLTRTLSSHFHHVVQTQNSLSEAFSDLAQKSPELQQEFLYNSETQRSLTKNGELLLSALNFFTSTVNTLCNKTIEDTLITIRQYESARIEYDAYRMDLENAKSDVSTNATQTITSTTAQHSSIGSEDTQRNFMKHKENYEKLRSDVAVKMQFLDENRIKVMHKQLVLLHNAVSAYFSGNANALEGTLKQFNIKLKQSNSGSLSWLEQ